MSIDGAGRFTFRTPLPKGFAGYYAQTDKTENLWRSEADCTDSSSQPDALPRRLLPVLPYSAAGSDASGSSGELRFARSADPLLRTVPVDAVPAHEPSPNGVETTGGHARPR